jgi:hypothetical protein
MLFGIFSLSIIIYQSKREKQFKIAELEMTLNEYTDISFRYISHFNVVETGTYSTLDNIKPLLPPEKIRITVIDTSGIVLYDNTIPDYAHLENHKT